MNRSQQIFAERFTVGTPRSAEYQDGCLYILRRKLDDGAQKRCPYPVPSAQADAWFAGTDYGHQLVRWERECMEARIRAGADSDE